jgi:hypothetical protein
MDRDTLKAVLSCVSLVALIGGWIWQWHRLRGAKRWPQTEASVQSGAFEAVEKVGLVPIRLPVFNFSYQVSGQSYAGRFSLLPYSNDIGQAIIQMVVGRKLPVKYDPLHPEQWFIPVDLIEGYKVEQKIGPHLQHYYPND